MSLPPPSALPSILIVDDDDTIASVLDYWLVEAGYRVTRATDGENALALLGRTAPEAVLLDLGLPGMSGLELLAHLTRAMPRLPVLIATGTRDVATVVTAMRDGAFDFLTKPFERERLLDATRRAVDHHRIRTRIAALERGSLAANPRGIIGDAPVMRALFRELEQAAAADITVLIHGESGSGKELVARALHEHSHRSNGPFVAINCAAIPESLQESELFGHEKGSFTGAVQRHLGRFEQADGGTLFLDEVAEIAPGLQAKLLRVFQERRFFRVGGTQEIAVDVRIVAATHRDLWAETLNSRFREDLYYRLSVFELNVPPLRERGSDLTLLVDHFLTILTQTHKKTELSIADETRNVIAAYPWPGNIRELHNALERAVVVARNGVIRPDDLPARILTYVPAGTPALSIQPVGITTHSLPIAPTRPSAPAPTATSLRELEQHVLEEAVARTHGNISAAARELGIARSTLYRRMNAAQREPERNTQLVAARPTPSP